MLGQKKYTVSFAPNMNELGWNKDFDTMDEFDYFIHDVKEKAAAAWTVAGMLYYCTQYCNIWNTKSYACEQSAALSSKPLLEVWASGLAGT